MQTTTLHIDYKSLYEQSQLQLAQVQKQNQQLSFQITTLQHELAQLKKLIFGTKQERFVPLATSEAEVVQGSLDLQAEQVAACKLTDTQKISYTRYTKEVKPLVPHPGRHALPAHLERRRMVIEPAIDTTGLKKIGELVSEQLEYEPARLYVIENARPQYEAPQGEGIIVAPNPDTTFSKCVCGPGLVAQLIISKFIDHLPLYRQMEIFKREGVSLSYNTLTDAISHGCKWIEPLYDALVKQLVSSDYLQADETPYPVLDKNKKARPNGSSGRGTTHKGYYWVYRSNIKQIVVFDYQQGRDRAGPAEMLKNFKGHLQSDGYVAYDLFKEREDITVLHCIAHARRKFFDALGHDKTRAEHALEQFGLLYDIERKAKAHNWEAAQLLQTRQQQAVPVLEQLGSWMKEQYALVLPQSPIGKALAYSIKRWKELCVYTTDAKLCIDNNPVENSLRPISLGRKNYLFAGSHDAAQRSAMLYSLLGTCKLHDVNPFVWLKDVLQRIACHPINKIEELLPYNWIRSDYTNSYAKLQDFPTIA